MPDAPPDDPEPRRMDATRLVPIDDALALAHALPPGEPADPWPQVRDILDEARSSLPDAEFAELVTAVRRVVAPLIEGRPPAWPPSGPASGDRLRSGPSAVVRDVRATLCLSARHGGPGSGHTFVMLGRRLDAHLDDLVTGHDI